ncbi:MAG TPA: hypothetical protein VLC74_01270 [Rhizomicrobium sp.]|nr:hypothetical protein [Rhizomicrobium sp.]
MPQREKMELLRAFLGSLPTGLAGRVAKAVEMDRMTNGHILPHGLILDSLRPSLRDADRPSRAPTPMRLFCRPFEDLLSNDHWGSKQKGLIPRSSITPVWNWLSQDLAPEAAGAFAIAVKTAALANSMEEVHPRAEEFWETAADSLEMKLGTESGRKLALQTLGSEEVVEDAREIALMLSAGPQICALQDCMPRVLPSLTDDVMQAYSHVCEKVAERKPAVVPYLPLVVMRRLEHPWEALRLPLGGASENGEPIPQDGGMVADLLLNAIEAHAAAVLDAQSAKFDAGSLAGHVAGFTRLSTGIAREIELRSDGAWGQRLVKDRAAVAEAMNDVMERSPQMIAAALPIHGDDQGERAHLPDLSQPCDPDKAYRALSHARLIADCRSLAGEGSFAASLKAADAQVIAALNRYNEEIVRALRVTDDDTRLTAEQYAALATELTAILISPDESESLRQQGRAAMRETLAA